MRNILVVCTREDFAITGMQVEREGDVVRDRRGKQSGKGRAREAADALASVIEAPEAPPAAKGTVAVVFELRGGRSLARLVDKLSEIDGVTAVNAGDASLISD